TEPMCCGRVGRRNTALSYQSHRPCYSRPLVNPSRIVRQGSMFVLGQKRLLTVGRPLPVYPYQQTFSGSVGMSQRCHNPTNAPQQTAKLFDHFVGGSEQRCWNPQSERSRCL